ncbi:putative family 2C serine/threonine protein phosphatase [Namao virus]|nr:putative family 2C serine/threonine protein phosphatase [Namao virus]
MSLKSLTVHTISLKGKRKHNEDRIKYINGHPQNNQHVFFYAHVLDGHGGSEIVDFLDETISKYFINSKAPYPTNDSDYHSYIRNVFEVIHATLKNIPESYSMGSAALIFLLFRIPVGNKPYQWHYMFVNLGDCRAVKCNKYNIAVPLTLDHKPFQFTEFKRIQSQGGKVFQTPGDDCRISGLSLSRTFGDLECPYIEKSPDIFQYSHEEGDKFIILACDGLWDVMNNQSAVNCVLNELDYMKTFYNIKDNTNLSFHLANSAISRGSYDNVSVILILFDQDE